MCAEFTHETRPSRQYLRPTVDDAFLGGRHRPRAGERTGIPLLGWSQSRARESGVVCDRRSRRDPACNSPVELVVNTLAETIENRVQRAKLPRPDDIDRYVGLCDHGGRFADA